MGNSDRQDSLAEEELTRVSLQSRSLWDALRRPLGDRFESEQREAIVQAQRVSSGLGQQSDIAQRLAYHHHMMKRGQEINKGLLGLTHSNP